jgi:hypothetical protein
MSRAAEPAHAPRYSLWLGGRLGLLAYAGSLYAVDANTVETTGNIVRPGVAVEVDAGARISRRYIPYLALEIGLVGPGHRFDQTSTTASTSFLGFGFRYLSGDVDRAAFVSDLSIGVRTFRVSNASGTWSASAWEILRAGLGAEIRLSTLFTLSPMVTVSWSSVSDTTGRIAYAPNQGDGLTGPVFQGQPIAGAAQTSYLAFVLGCGGHFDVFGK